MSLTTFHRATRHHSPDVDGPPASAVRDIPMPSRMPADELGRDIAFLLARHPELVASLGEPDLTTMSAESKSTLLAQIKARLGIRPVRRRDLGYVGPAVQIGSRRHKRPALA